MDKIMRRVRMAERRVLRRAQKQEASGKAAERWQHRNRVVTSTRQAGRQLAIAIKHRHEDWESGPIAPRRDVSRIDESGNYWGSITAEQANGDTPLITEEQLELRSAWAGGPKTLCLAVNDRVVILDGPYKGKISKVKSINKKNMTAQLDEDILVGGLLASSPRCQWHVWRILTHPDRPTKQSPTTCGPQTWTMSKLVRPPSRSRPCDLSTLCQIPPPVSFATSSSGSSSP